MIAVQPHAHWEWVRAGLLDCQRKGGGHLSPEDIYLQIKSGQAHLFLITNGFCVLQKMNDSDGGVLFILALWTEPGKGDWQGTSDDLDRIARDEGCVRIRMQSRRKWCRRTKFEAVGVIYEREL